MAACHASAKEQRFGTLKMGISSTFVLKRTMAAAVDFMGEIVHKLGCE